MLIPESRPFNVREPNTRQSALLTRTAAKGLIDDEQLDPFVEPCPRRETLPAVRPSLLDDFVRDVPDRCGRVELVAIETTPATISLDGAGARQQVAVTGHGSGGTTFDVTAQARFSVEPADLAAVSASGVVTPLRDGAGVARGACRRAFGHGSAPRCCQPDATPGELSPGRRRAALEGRL